MTSHPRFSPSGLYHLRSVHGQYKITKLDSDYEVETTYIVSRSECTCPAGSRPSCRHRDMLHYFLDAPHVDDGWMLDWSSRSWRKPLCEDLHESPIGPSAPAPWEDFPGIMIDLEDPATLHNTIASAIGEEALSTYSSPPEAAASAEVEATSRSPSEAPLAAASTLKRRRLP